MKKVASGNIDSNLSALGAPLITAYLYRGRSHTMMVDSGPTIAGPLHLKDIGRILTDSKRLDYLLLTHSHWDHCGGMPYLKRALPGLKIGGSSAIPELFQKESVVKTIQVYNDMAKGLFQTEVTEDVHFEYVSFDLVLKEGDAIDLGGVSCVVYQTPGHTRDSLSYYIPEQGILFPGESIGVPIGNEGQDVQVEFLSSYDDYLASIQKLAYLKPKIICMAHEWVFTDDDAKEYLARSHRETIRYRELILRFLDQAHGNVEAAVAAMAKQEYDEKGAIYQPRFAYVANLTVQVKHIAGITSK
jgi:glyoxylase-like metal-dependent hydrolase (beta-lactamase superfamily II)